MTRFLPSTSSGSSKRVHWDATRNEFISAPPSPAFSSSTSSGSSSSSSLQTPPQLPFYLSPLPIPNPNPYAYPFPSPSYSHSHSFSPLSQSSSSSAHSQPKPKQAHIPIGLHPRLSPGSHLPYDLSHRHPLSMHDPATSPPSTHMLITCPLLPWSIPLYSESTLTVSDVLNGIVDNLRTAVRKGEFESLGVEEKDAVKRAFSERCHHLLPPPNLHTHTHTHFDHIRPRRTRVKSDSSSSRMARAKAMAEQAEREKGVKRVDWLQGRTRFGGIEQRGEVWVLRVEWRIED